MTKPNKIKEGRLRRSRLLEVLHYCEYSGIFIWKISLRRGYKGKIAGQISGGYIIITIDGVRFLAHRLAWFYVYGVWPKDQLDHKDLNKIHNWISNLRIATNVSNQWNARKNRGRWLKGVTMVTDRTNKPYRSSIRHHGKLITIGHYRTEKEAHMAYCGAAKEYFGDYARFS